MTDFQRTRSKVWYSNLDVDDDDVHHLHSWRRQPSSSPESRRVSSGSPSNGSHRSQDSGFSDSESSPPGPSRGLLPKDGPQRSVGNIENPFTNELPDGVLSETTAPCWVPSQSKTPEPCSCFLPACELSRKFRFSPATGPLSQQAEEPVTPNRTCFIVDELPKSGGSGGGGGALPQLQATPSSVKSFDGHFDQSENVTVVENVQQNGGGADNDVGDDLIIEPPTPFVDRFCTDHDASDATSFYSGSDNGPDTPEHTSTPKSTKDRCCTPRFHYRKEQQLRKQQNLQNSYDRYSYVLFIYIYIYTNQLPHVCKIIT